MKPDLGLRSERASVRQPGFFAAVVAMVFSPTRLAANLTAHRIMAKHPERNSNGKPRGERRRDHVVGGFAHASFVTR
jgi:hypothetical protein